MKYLILFGATAAAGPLFGNTPDAQRLAFQYKAPIALPKGVPAHMRAGSSGLPIPTGVVPTGISTGKIPIPTGVLPSIAHPPPIPVAAPTSALPIPAAAVPVPVPAPLSVPSLPDLSSELNSVVGQLNSIAAILGLLNGGKTPGTTILPPGSVSVGTVADAGLPPLGATLTNPGIGAQRNAVVQAAQNVLQVAQAQAHQIQARDVMRDEMHDGQGEQMQAEQKGERTEGATRAENRASEDSELVGAKEDRAEALEKRTEQREQGQQMRDQSATEQHEQNRDGAQIEQLQQSEETSASTSRDDLPAQRDTDTQARAITADMSRKLEAQEGQQTEQDTIAQQQGEVMQQQKDMQSQQQQQEKQQQQQQQQQQQASKQINVASDAEARRALVAHSMALAQESNEALAHAQVRSTAELAEKRRLEREGEQAHMQ